MPTYDTPNSTSTYTTSGPTVVTIRGAGGSDGNGGDGGARNGAPGGYVKVELSSGTTIDIHVAASGNDQFDSSEPSPFGGDSPFYDGGDGGQTDFQAFAGGGGGSSAIVRQSDGAVLAAADGGGGGAAVSGVDTTCSGGGGARGGSAGEPVGQQNSINKPGDDGAGSGEGGDGGNIDNFGFGPSPEDGQPGGQTTHADVTVLNTNTGGGNSGDAVIEVTPRPTEPTSPSQTVEGDDQIQVSWGGDSVADGYDVQVSADGGGYQQVASPSSSELTYAATPAANTHRFRVRAFNSAGQSDWVYTTTKATDPTGLTSSLQNGDDIALSWDGVPDASQYRVLRAESSGSTPSDYTAVATPSDTTHTDADLEDGERYYYRVRAVYPGTDSQLTNEVARTTALPASSIDTLDTDTPNEITVSWSLTDDSPDGSVEIYRSTDGSLGSQVTTISNLSTTSWTDTGLADGTRYHYTIRRVASNASADSGQSSAVTILPAPTDLEATGVGEAIISIAWNATHDTGETRVEYKPTDTSTWSVFETIGRATETSTIEGLRNGERYDVRVVAVTDDAEEVDQ